ncbi:MAG: hypothetical protein ACR2FN_04210 [Chitinophagaceae bacterium]
MKCKFTLLILLICTASLHAQTLTGIWRGNFFSGLGFYKQQYKYEVQINELKNNALKGVTYSYRTTVFYGKARLQGIFMNKNNNIIIKEDSLLEVKMLGQSDACLMTCYLQYYKNGKTEVLEGTFTSVNIANNSDCGGGNVYLERVEESDFHKEDFLVKKKPETKQPVFINQPPKHGTNLNTKNNIKRLQTALGVTSDGVAGQHTLNTLKSKIPGYNNSPDFNDSDEINSLIQKIKRNNQPVAKTNSPKTKTTSTPKPSVKTLQPSAKKTAPKTDSVQQPTITKVNPPVTMPAKPQPQPLPPAPKILKERENTLVKTVVTNSQDIKIELYDNGEIDGDIVTVYHNNQLLVDSKELTSEPITIHITADENNPHHEFVMVANNLGKIPPNTALMVLTTGGKRYELSIVSDEQKNAKVIVDYEPKNK